MPLFENNLSPYLTIVETAEPTAPSAGQQRLYIDPTTHSLKATNSSGTERNLEGGVEIDYVQITSSANITATVEASANTLITGNAVTYDGTTTIMIEGYAIGLAPPSSGQSTYLLLFDGSTSLGYIGQATTTTDTWNFRRRLTPSNASHTYSIRGIVTTGTGSIQAGAGGAGNNVPAFIRITKV